MKKKLAFIPFILIIFSVFVFFYPFFFKGQLPIPSDTIVGLYYPFRDIYVKTNPNGVAYKNFLVTDPVRQQYVWKNLAINIEKQFKLPIWNPYEMAGTPLLANFQSGVFYPLNSILFINPFYFSWSLFILLQPLLMGIFLYLYLKSLRLDTRAAILGALVWTFCGFSISWLEWGTILHTGLWLPIILLSVDKIITQKKDASKAFIKKYLWQSIFALVLSVSFFAGHLQTFFYLFMFTLIYICCRIYLTKNINKLKSFIVPLLLFVGITFIQWFPTLQLINRSNRFEDQSFTQAGWFIPFQHLIQFIAPDFFGNPATLNYFGVWNYGEFSGYVGIVGLLLAFYAGIFRRDKKTLFFLAATVVSFIFVVPNYISNLPFILKIPFLSTAQPTRLLFIIDFCLSVLAAFGMDLFIRKKVKIWPSFFILFVCLLPLWVVVFFGKQFFPDQSSMVIAKNNLKLPSIIFVLSLVLFISYDLFKNLKIKNVIIYTVIIIAVFDLLRFGWKFTPFTNQEYLFPQENVMQFLQKQKQPFRIATTDSRILPPNFSVAYGIESIEGYDPLYLLNYAQFTAFNERLDHNITPPFGFNRIITPRNLNSQAIDFLNVKYVLSLNDIHNSKFKKVFQSGLTKVYENTKVLPRAFFVDKVVFYKDKDDLVEKMTNIDFSKNAVMRWGGSGESEFSVGKATIVEYSPNKIVIETENKGAGYLITSDTYYRSTRVTIDGQDHSSGFLPANIAFRGIFVPAGRHTVIFEPELFFIM